ncbi:bifunctional aconitate hydratase 2/2-methylisocitrate dehydratase, partial [Helicobacter pylori]
RFSLRLVKIVGRYLLWLMLRI